MVQGEPVISVFILKRLLGSWLCPPCEQAVATPAIDEPQPPELQGRAEQKPQLSGREAAILSGLVQGASNKVIAYQLKITEATVKVHVKAILRKIRVKNRTQAAIWALSRQALPRRLRRGGRRLPAHLCQLGLRKVRRYNECPKITESSNERCDTALSPVLQAAWLAESRSGPSPFLGAR